VAQGDRVTTRDTPLSYVYILISEDGRLAKIGTSVTPEKRRQVATKSKKQKFSVAWTGVGDEVLEGFLQHVLVHLRFNHDWFDFSYVVDIPLLAESVVSLWEVMGRPEEYRSTSMRCAKYPLLTEGPVKQCVAMPRFSNIAVRTDFGGTG